MALAGWGAVRLSTDQDGEFRSQWLTLFLRSMFTPAAVHDDTFTVDFLVNGSRLRARIDRATLAFDHHPTGRADVVISGDAAALSALARSRQDRTAVLAEGRVTVDGPPYAVAALQRALGLAPNR